MADIHDQFEQEHDLHESFENEPDHTASSSEEAPGMTESALRGAVQGATAGYSDEIAGALSAAASPVQVLSSDDKLGKLKQLYQQYRDSERQKNDAAEKANYKTYLAGNVMGGVAGLGKAGAGVKGAMALGALTGLGTSNADLTEGDVGGAVKDTAIGGTIGAIAGKIGQKLGNMVSPSTLKEGAAQSVGNAIGARGLPSARGNIGSAAIKAGILKEGVTEGGLNAIKSTATATEGELQPMLTQVNQGLQSINPETITQKLGGDAGDKVLDLVSKSHDAIKDMSTGVTDEFGEDIAPKMMDYVQKLKDAGNDVVRLNEIKRAAYQEGSDAFKAIEKAQRGGQPVPPGYEKWAGMAKDIGTTIKSHIEGLADIVDPTLASSIKATNQTAGGLAGARGALTSTLSKGVDGIKMSHPVSYVHNPKTAFLIDAMRNVGKVGMAKAGGQMALANGLESTVGENAVPIAKGAGELITRSAPMIQSTQEFLGGKKTDSDLSKPAQLSRSLYDQSDDQLKSVADAMGQSESFKHVAASLNNALTNKDVHAKNSALFLLSSNPQARKILKERGLINTSE